MEDETSRGYPLVAEREGDKSEAVNAGFRAIDADVAGVAAVATAADAKAQAALDDGGGTGNGGATETVVNVPANVNAWTDSGVTVTRDQPFIIEASGQISHGAGIAPYGPYSATGAYLVWLIVDDGSVPPAGAANAQRDFRVVRTGYRLSGRLFYRVHDIGGGSDNDGLFAVKTRVFANLQSVLAPLSEIYGLRDSLTASINALTIRVSALEASGA